MPTSIMRTAGAKPNRVVKAKKNTRRSTPHTKNYRFQSFSDRITNLKIDPIRRKRHVDREDVVEENTHSYFGSSLEAWKDTNLSQTFADFARAASPLSDNLPMVLHNEEKIMDLLVEYIEKGDELAMEPLLALLAHFAHDLDTRFEAHFQRAVSTVAAVAAKHTDFAVIEWSFTCLAWLFKYLSRLLTPDLRPLYDLLAPYLGQKEVKPFIVRFTAEALSFLLRKAAVIYQRDAEPLDHIMGHMLKDCKATMASNSADLLHQGAMTLLTEAIKGVQHGIHSSGVSVMLSLLKHAELHLNDDDLVMEGITSGVLTSLIHHCMDGSFQAILDVLLAHVEKTTHSPTNSNIRFCSNLLFTVISVRKGSRISDWKAVMSAVKGIIAAAGELPDLTDVAAHSSLALLAVALQTSSIDAALATRQTIESLRSGRWERYFLAFCDMVSRLGTERFDNFVLPHFQRFVLEHSQKASLELCTLLPRLTKSKPEMRFKCPSRMVDALLDEIAAVGLGADELSNDHAVLARANTALSSLPYLTTDKEQQERLNMLLLALVRNGLNEGGTVEEFALGSGLKHYLQQHDEVIDDQISKLWVPLCTVSANAASLPSFWSNLHRYVKKYKPSEVSGPHMEMLENALVASLCSSSHSIRTDALYILQALYEMRNIPEPEALAAAITIESTPISLDTARSISMNIRRAASEFSKLDGDDLMVRAVPTYCFGLLHVHLSQAWDDATTALATICQSKAGEDVVMDLAQSWIDGKAIIENDDVQMPLIVDVDTDGFKVFSDFECPNLAKISAIAKQVFAEPFSGLRTPLQQLSLDSKRVPVLNSTARSQALRVLHKIPHIAEKRSRILVPVLLKWASGSQSSSESESSDRWARKDQKAMLTVFSQFINPSVLFRSNEVHAALLALCANGDVEIQQSALKAILAWKEPSIMRYKEHLNNLLDEARFREELSVFLRGESREDEEEGIRAEDHAGLMPVLLRVLYGRAVAGGKEGQAGRRKAIFVALSKFGGETLEQFLDIALSSVVEAGTLLDFTESRLKATLRQQLGMMYMMNDMLQVLGSELEPSISKLMNGILACTASASRSIERNTTEEESPDLAMLRSIRQTGIQCLVKAFSSMSDFDTKHYGQLIADNLVVPRLGAFSSENAQSVSGSLRLISAWTTQPETATLFIGAGGDMLESVASLLQSPHSKDEVRLFILQNILDNLFHGGIQHDILQPRVSVFVQAIGAVIEQQPTKETLDASVKSFSMLAERITSQIEAVSVTKICTDLLKKPGKAVSPWIKTGLLRTLAPLIERFEVSGAKESLYPALCALFSRLKDSESRILLADVLSKLVRDDEKLVYATGICADMNALGMRLDEPDHERRDLAFKRVYQDFATLSLEQWLPVVHNCLFYIRDGEDRVNRTSSSRALELYIDTAAKNESDSAWLVFTEQSILAGIEFGIKEQSELVRSEYITVLGHLVEKLPNWQKVQGMQGLLVGGDEEASVFTNLLHIQQHRRLRALRRVKEESVNLGSANVSKIWIPSIEHFVFDADIGDAGRGLADEGILTIGALATSLSKTAFRGTFTRYAGYLKTRPEFEKIVLRLLGALVDGKKIDDGILDTKAILSEQLPPLMEYLHKKDDSTVDRRMPVAVTIVKLLKSLPEDEFKARLPAVLTDVSHVLRSKSQEARDQTRKALASIASLVGSQYFGFILKELRGALKRGPQLHVLSYTVHSLLVQGNFETGELDECLPHLMMVVMDDVFGATGAEKDAEEYRSAMMEVKSSKSFDTLELLARTTAVGQLGALVAPIRSLLEEKVDLKTVKKVDELFIRLRKGLDMNPESESRAMLVFCWEIVRAVRLENEAKAVAKAPTKVDERVQRYLIQPEEPKKSRSRGSTASYSFKLVSFSLNLLRKILKRHDDLQTPQNMQGFLPVAGDALVGGQEEVKLAALRFLATIMRISGLTELDENASVYLKESFNLLKAAPSLTTDSAKAALELVTSILRERRSVVVKERDLALLLKKLKTDIDEPDRQVIVYKFLRAVLGRKIVIAEVYEVLDAVGEVMVQNPTASIREAARSAYLQFVLEYPQGKDRWAKQTAFLTANLKFEHASGRMSVMEFLSLLVGKVSEEVLSEIAGTIFVHLMPVLCSDIDTKCRAMSGLLIGRLFERVGEKELNKMTALMSRGSWLGEGKKAEVRGGALQCWAVLLRSREGLPKKQLEVLRGDVQDVLSSGVEDGELLQPQLVLHALRTMAALVDIAPEVTLSKAAAGVWAALRSLPVNSETMEAIQETVASLLGTFFTDVASSSSKTPKGLAGLPLRGSGGLEISAQDMRQICSTELRALRAIVFKTSEVLITQIVRNLVFLGRCFAASGMIWNEKADAEGGEASSDDDGEDEKPSSPESNTALEYLFRRLSSALQADKFALASRNAALQTISALLHQLDTVPALQHVLRPLYNLTDTSIPQPPGELYKALSDKAQEVMGAVQKKVGAELFVEELSKVRAQAKTRRDGRRQKRRIEAVAEPERWAKEKKKKYESKKIKAKSKGEEARGKRRGW